MQSLQAFFKWYTNEGPNPDEARDKARENLTDLGWDALGYAATMIEHRAGEDFGTHEESIEWALRMNSWALRELALAICEPLQKMHEAVEEKAPSESGEHAIEVRGGLDWLQRNDAADALAYAVQATSTASIERMRRTHKLLWDLELQRTPQLWAWPAKKPEGE